MGSLWVHFWHKKVTFEALWVQFEVTLSISTSNFMCDACVMHIYTGVVGPKSGNVEKLLVFNVFFEGVKRALRILSVPAVMREVRHWDYFGGTLEAFWSFG